MSKLFKTILAPAPTCPAPTLTYYQLDKLAEFGDIDRLPFSIKVLLEALLRTCDGYEVDARRRDKTGRLGRQKRRQEMNCPSSQAALFCRILPACRPLSIWRRCVRRWPGWAAIPRKSTRRCRSIWSLTIPCR